MCAIADDVHATARFIQSPPPPLKNRHHHSAAPNWAAYRIPAGPVGRRLPSRRRHPPSSLPLPSEPPSWFFAFVAQSVVLVAEEPRTHNDRASAADSSVSSNETLTLNSSDLDL
ncbi:unnamed protein product [Heligmosomoides polygyrus]|uniref:Uncharacterized protein n=1 Tax=Heligmosomoides polygyrus TaxID=6339 RepID=A0A183FG26_HELPZ|nr:unnamed protein product [Heligmosomoides polygyrus]